MNPEVDLVAYTSVDFVGLSSMGYQQHAPGPLKFDHGSGFSEEPVDELAEAAGRLCYESWGRPNPATASNHGYINNIIDHQHFSVLEHGSATFFIRGISRACTHELVRHRHFSYSQVSQRYVDHGSREMVAHPILKQLMDEDADLSDIIRELHHNSREAYRLVQLRLRQKGYDKKTVNGAARGMLLESTETQIVVSGNHRAFREFLGKRLAPGADQEIRSVAVKMRNHLLELAPNIYQDFE